MINLNAIAMAPQWTPGQIVLGLVIVGAIIFGLKSNKGGGGGNNRSNKSGSGEPPSAV